ncbi:MAG: DUF47 domain-containing protein [Candidatus Limnocylindrales bacterium]
MNLVPRIVRDLTSSASQRFIAHLDGQLRATMAGAALVRQAVAGEVARAAAVEQMREIEHQGDAFRLDLIRELNRSIVTPIDREDLFRLARSIDDILDNLRDFLREWDLFEMEPWAAIGPVIDAVVAALVEMQGAVAIMASEPAHINARAMAAKKAGNGIRRLYELELAALYREPVSTAMLKQRDLLRRLDVVGLRFGEAADILSDAAVKRADS